MTVSGDLAVVEACHHKQGAKILLLMSGPFISVNATPEDAKTNGEMVNSVMPEEGADGLNFGHSINLKGDWLVVGAIAEISFCSSCVASDKHSNKHA